MKSAPKKGPRAGRATASERLQKIIAQAGIASRRAAEEMIAAGRVSVNGKVVTEMGVQADPSEDKIEVDGRPLPAPKPGNAAQEHVYIALNKPARVVSTARDTHGRRTVIDLVHGKDVDAGAPAADRQATEAPKAPTAKVTARVYPVGRLDFDSTGLLLLTNDGDLTFRLTHPRYGIEKEYRVLVRGRPGEAAQRAMREGIEIEGERTAPAKVEELGKTGSDTWLRITIHEGRKRQVRLMTSAVGHPVIELQRVRFGPITLGSLEPGNWRVLAVHEVHALRKAVGLPLARPRQGRPGREPAEGRANGVTGRAGAPQAGQPLASRPEVKASRRRGKSTAAATREEQRSERGRRRAGAGEARGSQRRDDKQQ